jgi:hypothetical protein
MCGRRNIYARKSVVKYSRLDGADFGLARSPKFPRGGECEKPMKNKLNSYKVTALNLNFGRVMIWTVKAKNRNEAYEIAMDQRKAGEQIMSIQRIYKYEEEWRWR